MLKRLLALLRSKIFIVAVLILIQLAAFAAIIVTLSEYFVWIYFLLIALSVVISIYVINRDDNPTYKMTWVLLIMALPILGGLVYLLFGGQKVPKELRLRDRAANDEYKGVINQDEAIIDRLEKRHPAAHKQANYLWKNAGFPVYEHTETTFFPVGEDKFAAMVKELKQAKKFIFIEYFIIEPGIMWDTILDILIEKVNEGLDVRVLYDDAGCFTKLPSNYYQVLQEYGIKAKVFNPIKPRLAMQMNNRDHRKILVIDGKVGMTGGINLADEYINKVDKFGHWKDCGVMLKGEAVWNLTMMFLQFWNYDETIKDDVIQFKCDSKEFENIENDGLVQPFCDSPTDKENVGEYTHINMINGANRYVYATTPYLVLDNEMKTSLMLAAKNGVDVRILVPHIPDKWYVFAVTRANYHALLEAGVKIYEYTPGFVHSKTFVVDDEMAIVGTVNMDYRSYYLHYECGVWFYKSKVVMDVKKDYLESLEKSHEVTLEECNNVKLPVRIMRSILNLFSPMM